MSVSDDIATITTGSGQTFRLALDSRVNDPIMDEIRAGTFQELDVLNLAMSILSNKSSLARGLVIDVGCHIGTFCSPLAAAGFSVLAVDANKSNVQLVAQTAALNGWDNLDARWTAVTDHAGTIGFTGSGPYGMVVDGPANQVSCLTLDELVNNRSISLVKMDVEGSEPCVVKGALNTLQSNPHIAVICESNWPILEHFGSSPQQLWGLLRSLGFDCYELFGWKLIPRFEFAIQERTVADFLAVRSATFEFPPGYSIAEATVEDSIAMFLQDVRGGHVFYVAQVLQFSPGEVIADARIGAMLREAKTSKDERIRAAARWFRG